MLSALDPPLYEGTASGITDKKTALSLKAFQRSKGLSVDGTATSGTLRALLESYMALQDTSLAADITPVVHGCQGHFDDSETSAGLEPDDRRLEVFFFPDEIYPAPPGGVSGPGSAAYPAWQKSLVETQDFEVHGIHVQIVDSKKQPVPFADAILEGPTSGAARADRHGFVSFFDLVAGAYTLRATKAGTKIGTYKITYPTAKTEPGKTRAAKSRAKSGVPL
jgi:peptidoglycan hydrolase-like protein with peptidoglycan-binding domain